MYNVSFTQLFMNILLKKIGARFLIVFLVVSILFSGLNISASNYNRVYASTNAGNFVSCQGLANATLYNSSTLPVSSTSSSGVGTNSPIPVTVTGNASTNGQGIAVLTSPTKGYFVNQVNIGSISSIKYKTTFTKTGGNSYISYFYTPDVNPLVVVYTTTNPSKSVINSSSCEIPTGTNSSAGSVPKYSINSSCATQGTVNSQCVSCLTNNGKGNPNFQYVYTDFGCVNTSLYGVINFVYKLVLTLAFMLAFAVIIFAGYLIMVSGGDPEKLGRGKSLMTKAIIGLLVIIFAFILLNSIGYIFNIQFLQDL